MRISTFVNRAKENALRLTAILLVLLTLLPVCFAGCSKNPGDAETSGSGDTTAATGTADGSTDEGTAETEAEEVTETEKVTETETETESEAITETESDTADSETSLPDEEEVIVTDPEFVNPLTGLAADTDLSNKRPIAIMINNIKTALPQHGITDCDIMYEIIAEGGITRLMMVVTEYEKLGIVGSVRSTRHYYVDYVRGMDAMIAHAGGSKMAYDTIDDNGVLSLDGVRTNLGKMYYRDEWRKKNMGYAHSLMTTGERIVIGINKKKYGTTHKSSFENTMEFVQYGTRLTLDGKDATHVKLKYGGSQTVDLIYDAETDKYLRYQYGGYPHIDKNNDKQLSFDNVVIVLTDIHLIKGDAKNRHDVKTTGTGKGFFIAGGKSISVTWTKKTEDSPLILTDAEGNPVLYNRGQTFISIFDEDGNYKIDTSSFKPKS